MNVTFRVCCGTPGEARMIWAVYVPATSPAAFAVTVSAAGVVALVGLTVSQPWP